MLHEVGETTEGHTIYRQKNPDIGGWDYVSDSAGVGWIVVNAMASIEELEVILADMKKMRDEGCISKDTKVLKL